MSYDIDLKKPPCPTCGHETYGPELPNPTYNLTPIFDLALTGEDLPNPDASEFAVVLLQEPTDRPRGLRVLSGKLASETIPTLAAACQRLSDASWTPHFRALEPANGWGDLAGAREVMAKLLQAATSWPDHVWEIR